MRYRPQIQPSLRLHTVLFFVLVGSLSNDNGDGYQNVTGKVNSRCFKLYRPYFISFNSSNVGKCLWSWILKDCIKVPEKENKIVVLCSRPRQNVKSGVFTLYSCNDVKLRNIIQKSVMHVQSCYFTNLNLLVYCRSPCRRRRRCFPYFIPGTYVSLCTESYLFIYLFTYVSKLSSD